MIRTTHTLAELSVSRETYDEIAAAFRAAGYHHVFDGETMDMTGVGIVIGISRPRTRKERFRAFILQPFVEIPIVVLMALAAGLSMGWGAALLLVASWALARWGREHERD